MCVRDREQHSEAKAVQSHRYEILLDCGPSKAKNVPRTLETRIRKSHRLVHKTSYLSISPPRSYLVLTIINRVVIKYLTIL